MKQLAYSSALALAVFALGGCSAVAQKEEQHQAHHPDGGAAESVSAPSKGAPSVAGPEMARMDAQMKSMEEMHARMMAAKTPAERNALMAEHMKTMQDSMTMMNGMSSSAMGGMGAMKSDMGTRHQMMEKRMEMMQAMMQMTMDRLPTTPAK